MAAGCGGEEIEANLRFADRSDAEIERLVAATAGCSDLFQLTGALNYYGRRILEDQCPSITVSGDNVATITGGCARESGTRILGSATVTNPIGWDHVEDDDSSRDTVYTADQLVIISETGTTTLDGTVRWIDGESAWDGDVTVTIDGITLRSDLTYTNRGNEYWPSWELSGNGIELVGVGGAHASGTAAPNFMDVVEQDFALQGADRVTISGDSACVAWSIDGTDRGRSCP